MSPAGLQKWDRKGAVNDYIQDLWDASSSGLFDTHWVDDVLDGMVDQLRFTYAKRELNDILDGLEKYIEQLDARAEFIRGSKGEPKFIATRVWTKAISRQRVERYRPRRFARFAQWKEEFDARNETFRQNRALDAEIRAGAALQKRQLRAEPTFEKSRPTTAPPAKGEAARAKPAEVSRKPSIPATPIRKLDGSRLTRSIVPTWLCLIFLSWISLITGAILTMPVGVGAAVAGTAFMGAIAVPLWATFWGLVGMSRASRSTFDEFKFTSIPQDHPLAEMNRKYASDLGIPAPKLGTIGGRELGSQHRDALYAVFRLSHESEVQKDDAHPIGYARYLKVVTTWRELLKVMGLSQHANNIAALHFTFEDIKKVVVTVYEGDEARLMEQYRQGKLPKTKGKMGNLLDDVEWDGLGLDDRVLVYYGDWTANMVMSAKLVSLNADVQFALSSDYAKSFWPYIDSLHRHNWVDEDRLAELIGRDLWAETETSATRRDFRSTCRKAFDDMVRAGGLRSWRVEIRGDGRKKTHRYCYDHALNAQPELPLIEGHPVKAA